MLKRFTEPSEGETAPDLKGANAITIDKVDVIRADHYILSNLSVQLTQKRVGIIGANGSGKSTFARLLNGLTLPSNGCVSVNGLNTSQQGKAVRRKVGFVFQNPEHQIVMPLVEEDLAFGLKNLKLDKAEIAARIDDVLARYDLSHLRHQSAHLLSGGQKQLLAICGVLIMRPEIIVLDEPTTLLDLRNKRRIASVLAELEQQIIVISHDLELLKNFDRILVFEKGKIVCDSSPQQAIDYYESLMGDV